MHLAAGDGRGFSRANMRRLAGLAPQEAEASPVRQIVNLLPFLSRAAAMGAQHGVAATMRRRFGAMAYMRKEWPEREPPEPCALKACLRAGMSATPDERIGEGYAPNAQAHAAAPCEAS